MKKIIPVLIILILIFILVRPKEDSTITVIQGDYEQIIEKDFIYEHTDSVSFPAVVRSSGKKPVATEYKGIEISKFLSSLNIDITTVDKIRFNATDGYRVILNKKEIDKANNVYLTFERDGEYMKSKEGKGNGPFQLVIREDPFSQRWIKHVDKIILE